MSPATVLALLKNRARSGALAASSSRKELSVRTSSRHLEISHGLAASNFARSFSTISLIELLLPAITGAPNFIASMMGSPQPSQSEGDTKNAHDAKKR